MYVHVCAIVELEHSSLHMYLWVLGICCEEKEYVCHEGVSSAHNIYIQQHAYMHADVHAYVRIEEAKNLCQISKTCLIYNAGRDTCSHARVHVKFTYCCLRSPFSYLYDMYLRQLVSCLREKAIVVHIH